MCYLHATYLTAMAWWTASGLTNSRWSTRYWNACTPTANSTKSTLTARTCGTPPRCSRPPARRSTCSPSSRRSSLTHKLTSGSQTQTDARSCTSRHYSTTPTSWSMCSTTSRWQIRSKRFLTKKITRGVPLFSTYCVRIIATWICKILSAMSWRK